MKTKKIILSFIVCLCALFPLFTLAGCGISVDDVKSSFAQLDEAYIQYAEAFEQGTLENNLTTNYVINYGVDINNISSQNQEKFDALKEKYNVMLALSSKYIDNNKDFITSLENDDLSDETKKALENLNGKLTSYINYLPTFVEGRNSFKNHFKELSQNEIANLETLNNFKKVYGTLVNKNLDLALSMANVVETTEIFDLLQSTTQTNEDTKIVKDYITTKLLPIFNQLLIVETETSFAYDDYSGGAMEELNVVVQKLENLFVEFKQNLALTSKECQALDSKEDMQKLFENFNNFSVEINNYSTSVSELKIYDMVVNHKNSFEEHKKHVKLAEIYFDKIDQFVSITLEEYLANLISVIF